MLTSFSPVAEPLVEPMTIDPWLMTQQYFRIVNGLGFQITAYEISQPHLQFGAPPKVHTTRALVSLLAPSLMGVLLIYFLSFMISSIRI